MCALHFQKEFWVVARVVTKQVHPQVSMIFWSLNMIRVNLWDFFFSIFYCSPGKIFSFIAKKSASTLLLNRLHHLRYQSCL